MASTKPTISATQDPPTPTPPTGNFSHFMRLPAELRLEIYCHVLALHTIQAYTQGAASTTEGVALPLLLTSRLIRKELLKPYRDHLYRLSAANLEKYKINHNEIQNELTALRNEFRSLEEWNEGSKELRARCEEVQRKYEVVQDAIWRELGKVVGDVLVAW